MMKSKAVFDSEIFETMELVATGGMAQIYRAKQKSLDRWVAVKKLKADLVSFPEVVERFRREARALSQVLHQNVAHVYDFQILDGEYYIIMEYIEGLDLSEIIRRAGHLPKEVAAAILLELCRGLSFIHRNNLVHRDVKPTNIRLTRRGQVKIMDFGIVMEQDSTQLTRPGTMIGSPGYLSPEQVLGDNVTLKSDIFLLGITFYEMLTGERPFFESDGETIYQRIRQGKYIRLKEKLHKSKTVQKIVEKCLQVDPEDRYARVEDVMNDLKKYLGVRSSSESIGIILDYLDQEGWLSVDARSLVAPSGRKKWVDILTWIVVLSVVLCVGISIGVWIQKF